MTPPVAYPAATVLAAAALTDTGRVRTANEDSIACHPGGRLWAVADGMGGHSRGDWASAQVAEAILAVPLGGDLDTDCETIADALAAANTRIFAAGQAGGATIGTTVVALLVAGDRYACLWAGDSRAYRLRDGAIRQLSRDHSQVDQLVAAGLVRPEDADRHPLANVVTRAVGAEGGLALDVVEDAVLPGDRFLLCSDGLNKCLSDAEIAGIAAGLPPADMCRALVAAVLARGAPDNVSVIAIAAR